MSVIKIIQLFLVTCNSGEFEEWEKKEVQSNDDHSDQAYFTQDTSVRMAVKMSGRGFLLLFVCLTVASGARGQSSGRPRWSKAEGQGEWLPFHSQQSVPPPAVPTGRAPKEQRLPPPPPPSFTFLQPFHGQLTALQTNQQQQLAASHFPLYSEPLPLPKQPNYYSFPQESFNLPSNYESAQNTQNNIYNYQNGENFENNFPRQPINEPVEIYPDAGNPQQNISSNPQNNKDEVQILYVPVEMLEQQNKIKNTQSTINEAKKFRHPIQPLRDQVSAGHWRNAYSSDKFAFPETTEEAPKTTSSIPAYSTRKSPESDNFNVSPNKEQYLEDTVLQDTVTRRSPARERLPSTLPPPNQPPLSVFMESNVRNKIGDVLSLLKESNTIPVLDSVGPDAPQVFVGPSNLKTPLGYIKYELPYLSSLTSSNTLKLSEVPFFVAPLNFQAPPGFAKIPFPPPHIGSVVVSNLTDEQTTVRTTPPSFREPTPVPRDKFTIPADISSISPQLPSLINSLQVDEYPRVSPTESLIEPTEEPTSSRRPSNFRRGNVRGSHRATTTTTSTTIRPRSAHRTRRPTHRYSNPNPEPKNNTPPPDENYPDLSKFNLEAGRRPVATVLPNTNTQYEERQNHDVHSNNENENSRNRGRVHFNTNAPEEVSRPTSGTFETARPEYSEERIPSLEKTRTYQEQSYVEESTVKKNQNSYDQPSHRGYNQGHLLSSDREIGQDQARAGSFKQEADNIKQEEEFVKHTQNSFNQLSHPGFNQGHLLSSHREREPDQTRIGSLKQEAYNIKQEADNIKQEEESVKQTQNSFNQLSHPAVNQGHLLSSQREREPDQTRIGNLKQEVYNIKQEAYNIKQEADNIEQEADNIKQEEESAVKQTQNSYDQLSHRGFNQGHLLSSYREREPDQARVETFKQEEESAAKQTQNSYSQLSHRGVNQGYLLSPDREREPDQARAGSFKQEADNIKQEEESSAKHTQHSYDQQSYQGFNRGESPTSEEVRQPSLFDEHRYTHSGLQNHNLHYPESQSVQSLNKYETSNANQEQPSLTTTAQQVNSFLGNYDEDFRTSPVTLSSSEPISYNEEIPASSRPVYSDQYRTTTKPPTYDQFRNEDDKKELGTGERVSPIKSRTRTRLRTQTQETLKSDLNSQSQYPVEAKQESSRKFQARGRRPTRPTTQSTTASPLTTTTYAPGGKYLIRTRKPTVAQTKLQTGRGRIRKPTIPTTTQTTTQAAPTETPHRHRELSPRLPYDSEEYTVPIQIYNEQPKVIHEQRNRPKTRIYDDGEVESPSGQYYTPTNNNQRTREEQHREPESSYISNPTVQYEYNKKSQHIQDYEPIQQTPQKVYYSRVQETTPQSNFETENTQYQSGQISSKKQQESIAAYNDNGDWNNNVRKESLTTAKPQTYDESGFSEFEDYERTRKPLTTHRGTDANHKLPSRNHQRRRPSHVTRSEIKDRYNIPESTTKRSTDSDFLNQAVLIQQSQSYVYNPDDEEQPLVESTNSKIIKTKPSYSLPDYDDDQSPYPSNEQQRVTYVKAKINQEIGKVSQYPEKSQSINKDSEIEKEPAIFPDSNSEENPKSNEESMSNNTTTGPKKTGKRRGTWVRVRVKKPVDVFQTAESQRFNSVRDNSLLFGEGNNKKVYTSLSSGEKNVNKGTWNVPSPSNLEETTTKVSSDAELTSDQTSHNSMRVEEGSIEKAYSESESAVDKNENTAAGKESSVDKKENTAAGKESSVDKHENGEESSPTLDELTTQFSTDLLTNANLTTLPPDTTTFSLTEDVKNVYDESGILEGNATDYSNPEIERTSTTTEISLETEICYKGRCIKTKRNKNTKDNGFSFH